MATALRLSVDEYDQMVLRGAFDGLQKRIELFRGELIEKNPAGPVHDDHISYLTRWSIESTQGKKILVRIQSGLSLPELESRPEPDVLWVKDRRYLDRHPRSADVLLAIEVADSSKHYDRNQKSLLYAQASIVEFWVVDIQDCCVVVHRQPSNEGYLEVKSFGPDSLVQPLAVSSAELIVRELFAM